MELRDEINKIKKGGHGSPIIQTQKSLFILNEIWGIKCIKEFRGMFAFALWDEKEKNVAGQNGLGIKAIIC